MRSIGKLFTAFATLADSVLSLAGVIDVATGRLRQQLALDEATPALAHSGEVLDHAEADSSTNGASTNGNGKNRKSRVTA